MTVSCKGLPRFGLFLILCVSASIPVQGASPVGEHLSLAQAVDVALHHHPSLRRLGEEALAAEAQEDVAYSAYLPRLTLEAVGKEGPPGAPGLRFNGLANSTAVRNVGASMVLEQMILDFGRTQHRVQASRWFTEAAEARTKAQRDVVTLGVYQAYYRALLARKLVDLSQENLSARGTILKQAEARAKAGLASRVDEGLARAGLAEAQAGLVNARNDRLGTLAELNVAMGVIGAPDYVLEDPPGGESRLVPASATSPALEQEALQALARRPEMLALQRQIQALGEQAEAARAEERPVLRALGSAGYINADKAFDDNDRTWAVGLSLSYPLYTGGEVPGQVAGARHRQAALQAARDELTQAIRLQVAKARMALDALEQSRPAVAEQVKQAGDSEKLASRRYREGLGDFLERQQAQLSLLAAETSAARLRYDLVTAHAALRYALGTLPVPPGDAVAEGR